MTADAEGRALRRLVLGHSRRAEPSAGSSLGTRAGPSPPPARPRALAGGRALARRSARERDDPAQRPDTPVRIGRGQPERVVARLEQERAEGDRARLPEELLVDQELAAAVAAQPR